MENTAFKGIVVAAMAITLLVSGGCIGPHYTREPLVVNGKAPPVIRGPRDPAIEANLSTHPWPKSPLVDRSAEVGVTLFKSAGIQGWKDYHMHARALGVVVQHEYSSNGFLTMDLRLAALQINRRIVPLDGPKYIRLEIFLGNVSVDKDIYTDTNALVIGEGKFVWDSDGWFEIHPQKTGDVRLGQAMPPFELRRLRSTNSQEPLLKTPVVP